MRRHPKNIRWQPLAMSLLAVAAAFSGCASSSELSDFTSDGCSLFPDGTWRNRDRWFGCCYVHDVRYWEGGAQEARKRADSALRACVLEATGDEVLANLMYDGVRVGGHPVFPTPYRWGFGWPYERATTRLRPRNKSRLPGRSDNCVPGLKRVSQPAERSGWPGTRRSALNWPSKFALICLSPKPGGPKLGPSRYKTCLGCPISMK